MIDLKIEPLSKNVNFNSTSYSPKDIGNMFNPIKYTVDSPTLVLDADTGGSSYIASEDILTMLDNTISQLEKEKDSLEESFNSINLTEEEQKYYAE